MDKITRDERIADDRIAAGQRRSFLKLLGSGVIGATGVAAGLAGTQRAEAKPIGALWSLAEVFIGRSTEDQDPSKVIKCPMYFANGSVANAEHTLDLTGYPVVTGSLSYGNDIIHPNFGVSFAVALSKGSDGVPYLLVAAEGPIPDATGYFSRFTSAIVRCKYKIEAIPESPECEPPDLGKVKLVACDDCVAIVVRDLPA